MKKHRLSSRSLGGNYTNMKEKETDLYWVYNKDEVLCHVPQCIDSFNSYNSLKQGIVTHFINDDIDDKKIRKMTFLRLCS